MQIEIIGADAATREAVAEVIKQRTGLDCETGKSKHTPGPWGCELQRDIDEEGNGYCWAVTALTREQRERSKPGVDYIQNPAYANTEANARLIAAAPGLLAALEAIANGGCDDKGPNNLGFVRFPPEHAAVIARAAIAKLGSR